MFVRELAETQACDDVYPLADVRHAVTSQLQTSERLERIMSFDETKKDERIAFQALIHHRLWLEAITQKAFNSK